MEEQKRQMEREMKEMRDKVEKMTSPVTGKPEARIAKSMTRKPEQQKRKGQSTFYKVTIYT